jgi:zona occludens toxin
VLHLSDNSGTSTSHVLQAKPFNKVPKYVFKLYDSTTTGKVSDTVAGSSLLRDPKILFFLGVMGFCLYFGFIKPEYIDAPRNTFPATPATAPAAGEVGTPSGAGVRSGGVPAAVSGGALSIGPFAGHRLIISCHVLVKDDRGSYRVEYCFALRKGEEVQPVYSDDWPDQLARVEPVSACHAVIQYQGQPVDVFCDPDGDALRRRVNGTLFAGAGDKGKPSDDRT